MHQTIHFWNSYDNANNLTLFSEKSKHVSIFDSCLTPKVNGGHLGQYVAYLKITPHAFIKLSAKSHRFNILCTMYVLNCPLWEENTRVCKPSSSRGEGCGFHLPLEMFSLSTQNQKESDLSHLANLNYIICGHFDEKKIGGTPWRGKVSCQRWRVREVVATWEN